MKPIAIDWDGVIIDHPADLTLKEALTYKPVKDAVEVINQLVKAGFQFYILTARSASEHPEIREWLRNNGFPEMEVTNIKRVARVYVDDRAIRFTNWQDLRKLLF